VSRGLQDLLTVAAWVIILDRGPATLFKWLELPWWLARGARRMQEAMETPEHLRTPEQRRLVATHPRQAREYTP
jgi:hypothetical protein